MTDLRDAHQKGLIARTPHFNTISNTLEDDAVTEVLRGLITESSLPLKSVEVDSPPICPGSHHHGSCAGSITNMARFAKHTLGSKST